MGRSSASAGSSTCATSRFSVTGTCCPFTSAWESARSWWGACGVKRVIVGTYRGNYKAQHALEKAGYRQSPDPDAILRAYYSIPEARPQASLTYEKTLPPK